MVCVTRDDSVVNWNVAQLKIQIALSVSTTQGGEANQIPFVIVMIIVASPTIAVKMFFAWNHFAVNVSVGVICNLSIWNFFYAEYRFYATLKIQAIVYPC